MKKYQRYALVVMGSSMLIVINNTSSEPRELILNIFGMVGFLVGAFLFTRGEDE